MERTETEKKICDLASRSKKMLPIEIATNLRQIAADCKDLGGLPLSPFLGFLTKCCIQKDPSSNMLLTVEEIIQILNKDKRIKRSLLTADNLMTTLLNLVIQDSITEPLKKEALAILNAITSLQISAECRTGVRKKHETLVLKVAHKIFTLGDYETQLVLLELMMRLCGQEDPVVAKTWFRSDELTKMFCQIKKQSFEPQARPFLNTLNKSCGAKARVKSIACKRMKVLILYFTYSHTWAPDFFQGGGGGVKILDPKFKKQIF
jgi:hypothetical protein